MRCSGEKADTLAKMARVLYFSAIRAKFIAGALSVWAGPAIGETGGPDLAQRLEVFLQPRRQTLGVALVDEQKLAAIRARADPGTFFLRYAFGLKLHANELLAEPQQRQLLAVLDRHTPANLRWHDERNTLRCKWNEWMWFYAAASDGEAPALRVQLLEWMRLRMIWTEQEHLAQFRFARAVWDILTPEQQSHLLAGGWKAFAKQDTGHTRGDFMERIVTRALGKPDDQAALDSAIADWSKQRAPLHAALTQAEDDERCIVFAMDLNSESMAHAASLGENAAFSALYIAEADAMRRVVQGAYRDPSNRCVKAAADAWAEAPKRFAAGAAELLRVFADL